MKLRRKKEETREDTRWGERGKRRRDTEDRESTGGSEEEIEGKRRSEEKQLRATKSEIKR